MTEQRIVSTILVPIDFYGISPRAMDTLIRIARRLDRNLLGVVLENRLLQRVAELPFTTEILLSTGTERSLERDHLHRYHSRVAGETTRRLHELAERDKIKLAFESEEGDRWHCVLTRQGEMDVFIPARDRWLQRPATTDRNHHLITRLGLVLTGGQSDQKTLAAATALAEAGLVGSLYLLSNGAPDPGIHAAFARCGCHVHLQSHFRADPTSVASLIRRSPYDLLLLPRDCLSGVRPAALGAGLDDTGGQVMVIS